jgi:grpE
METNKNKSGKEARKEHKADDAPEVMDVLDAENDSAAEDSEETEQDLARDLEATQAALEKEKKEYLFLMAEFDNYRKRVVKEKSEILRNGAEKVLAGLLPIVDDFERGLAATADADDAAAVRSGMELIYNKLVKYLESNGVKAMDSTGKEFDPELHEAIASIPAPSDDLKGKVVDTTQKGYMINDKVLRHAKVAVGQ